MLRRSALLALLLAALPSSAADPVPVQYVEVTIDVTLLGHAYEACVVTVPRNATGGDALDAAVADGCLEEWRWDTYPGLGRYVVSIDGVEANPLTYWALTVGGGYSDVGIDGLRLQQGDAIGFDYRVWVVEPYLP